MSQEVNFKMICPWCNESAVELLGELLYDENGLSMYNRHNTRCPHCQKPVRVNTDLIVLDDPEGPFLADELDDFDMYVQVDLIADPVAVKEELELYQRRMNGDWS